jgi:hypothetical protein
VGASVREDRRGDPCMPRLRDRDRIEAGVESHLTSGCGDGGLERPLRDVKDDRLPRPQQRAGEPDRTVRVIRAVVAEQDWTHSHESARGRCEWSSRSLSDPVPLAEITRSV